MATGTEMADLAIWAEVVSEKARSSRKSKNPQDRDLVKRPIYPQKKV